MVDTGLKGKVALITGANHGIGAATAVAFAREGADVFLTYLRLFSGPQAGESPSEAEITEDPGRRHYHKIHGRDARDVVSGVLASGGRCEAWEAVFADRIISIASWTGPRPLSEGWTSWSITPLMTSPTHSCPLPSFRSAACLAESIRSRRCRRDPMTTVRGQLPGGCPAHGGVCQKTHS